MKKLIAMLLVAGLVGSVSLGCGGPTVKKTEKTTEKTGAGEKTGEKTSEKTSEKGKP